MLCHSHGIWAEVGGVIGGGFVGLLAGILYGYGVCVIGAIAVVFWQLIVGRLKLPHTSSSTNLHRRMVFKLIAGIFIVFAAIWAGIYFAGSDAQRSSVLYFTPLVFGTFLIGILILKALYRRYPPEQESDKHG